MISGKEKTTSWEQAHEALASASTYWLATTRPDGRPHVQRVLGVWSHDAFHFCTSPLSRKGRNLEANTHLVATTTSDGLDLVLEGMAIRVTDEQDLHKVAEAYASKYGWYVAVRDGAFQDTEGAPTAGPPPYYVFRVKPVVAFSLGADDGDFSPTRWMF